MAPLPLTFAIELEFLVLFHPSTTWPTPDDVPEIDDGCRGAIYWALLDAGLEAKGWQPKTEESQDDEPSYSRWSVGSEFRVLSSADEILLPPDYMIEGIQLTSPVFDARTKSWEGEIRQMLNTLAQMETDTGCRFMCNASTSFRVRVGCGVGNKIPLEAAKNLLMLMTAHERFLDRIHATDRICYSTGFLFDFCHAPLSFFHANNRTDASTTLFDWLANIQDVQTYDDLGPLFALPSGEAEFHGIDEKRTYSLNSTVNVENLFADEDMDGVEDPLTGTIEFRQHTGTLDRIEIAAYISLTVRLVQYSARVSDVDLLTLCTQGADPAFGLNGLFTAVGCNRKVVEHYECVDSEAGAVGAVDGPGRSANSSELDPLLAQNSGKEAERVKFVTKRIDIAFKDCGLDQAVNILMISEGAIPRYLRDATRFCAEQGTFMTPEEIGSAAKGYVLRHLGMLYRGEDPGVHDEAIMAETDASVYFGRWPRSGKGDGGVMENAFDLDRTFL
ncbi:hypothetical protein B0A55_09498 [Friedmanniomyces simplex]|uniref:Uncharacterized protein n=1 Tax=Friedmanniomyces simplex TaxID=329884 RepID=A0A4U0X903_9PEZI|nr:hypothetical protein B0A55_09498 [Friedmanniomyces simplex]